MVKGMTKRFTKEFIQDCFIFAAISLFICALPLLLIIDPIWCPEVGGIIILISFWIFVITGVHKFIFGG